jgi:ubiquinone/menaquinone biosynthesis C-methylase UbiE
MNIVCPFHKKINFPSKNQCDFCGYTVKNVDDIDFHYYINNVRKSEAEYENEYSNYAEIDLKEGIYSKGFQKYIADQTCNYISNIDDNDIAELGVGKGEILSFLLNKNPKSILALDIAPAFVKEAQKSYNNSNTSIDFYTALGNIEYMPFDDCFDTVIATDILEHVMNLGNALIRISKSMKINGYFYCRVPLDEALGQYSIYNGCDFRFAHLRSFNEKILSAQFNEVGLKIEKYFYLSFLKNRLKPGLSKYSLDFLEKIYTKMNINSLSDVEFNILLSKNLYFWFRLFHQPLEVIVVAKKIN